MAEVSIAPPLILSLQVGRAIAAMAVVVNHSALATQDFSAKMPDILYSVSAYGYLGVDFFFVLSGFILTYTAQNLPKRADAAIYFLKKRVLRIFVPYWPVAIAMALAYLLLPSLSQSEREWGWLATLFLVPVELPSAQPIAWTLQHEILFYGLFTVLFFSGFLLTGMLLWAGLIAAVWAFTPGDLPAPASFLLSPLNIEFLFGVIAAKLMTREKITNALCIAGFVIGVAVYFSIASAREHSVILGFAIACGILPVVRAEAAGRLRIGAIGRALGDASYAIYLTHSIVVSAVARLSALVLPGNWFACFVLAISASLLVGLLYHFMFERRALAWCRAHILHRRFGNAVGVRQP